MKVSIEKFVTGPLDTNTCVVYAGTAALVFDPSGGCGDVIEYCRSAGFNVQAIVLTHCHFDHIMGIPEIQNEFGPMDVWVHPLEKIMLTKAEYNGSPMIGAFITYDGPTRDIVEGKQRIGDFDVNVLHVPGHSPGGCVFVFDKQCIVGDVVFAGSVGRSDLPGGDGSTLIKTIKEKILPLEPETVLWPGHGGRTTVGREKKLNPFLQPGVVSW